MKKNKLFVIITIVIILTVILGITGTFLIGNYIEDKLQNQQVDTYHITSREAKVNLFLTQVKIINIEILDSESDNIISIPEIDATGIQIFPLLFKDRLIINKLDIYSPEIVWTKEALNQEGIKEKREANMTSEQEIDVEYVRIKKLKIKDASFSLQKPLREKPDTIFFINSNLEIWELNINSNQEKLTFKDHSAKQIQIMMNNGRFNLPGGLYRLQIESIAFDSVTETLSCENIYLASLYSKYELGKFKGVQTDWYDISLKVFELKGINMDALLTDTALIFRTALLEEMNAHIFRDKRYPFPEKPDTKLPMEMMESLPFSIHTDSVLIKRSNIIYEEFGEESVETGMVSFNQLYASVYNFSTITSLIEGQTAMSARAMVMNESLLNAEFIFPNNKFSHQYSVNGYLEAMNITSLNPMIVPSAFVKVKDGHIKRLDFKFVYDSYISKGNLNMEYEDLDISALDKEDGSKKKIKSFIIKTFVLKKDNLKEKNSYQEGSISFERNKKKSIFNYWWKSIFSGIQDILVF